jgi:oligopeptide/dipeptide ABC transporter ATP-binding protein
MIKVEKITKYFSIERGFLRRKAGEVRAVDGVSFEIQKGQTLGLVGESGCGKTTVGKLLLGLERPNSGTISHETGVTSQVVFQDPFGSLNPRVKVKDIITEGLLVEKSTENRDNAAKELLRIVGLPEYSLAKYPHQFSGGERQRISIARAIATKPNFIVCDEPVSSLDVSIRVQILKLLLDLQKKFTISYLFIAHDLGVVQHMSHAVAVMYLGKIVEYAPREELYANPQHPYSKVLLSSSPTPYPGAKKERIVLKGEPPSASSPPLGCRFHTRCPYAFERCSKDEPRLKECASHHLAACHLAPK